MNKTDPTLLWLRLWLNNNPDVVATEAAPQPTSPCFLREWEGLKAGVRTRSFVLGIPS